MPIRHLAALALLAGVSLIPLSARADNNPVGTVVAIEGGATLSHNGQKSKAARDMKIYEGDKLETSKKSKICVMFIDNTWFILGENAQIEVDEYVFDPNNKSENHARFQIPEGAFEYASGAMDKKAHPEVTIQAHYGSIGIRGTKVLGGSLGDSFSIFDKGGSIFVSTNDGTVDLGPGFGSDLTGNDDPPGSPSEWPPEKIKKLQDLVNFKDPDELNKLIAAIAEWNKKHHPHHTHDAPTPDDGDHTDGARDDLGPDTIDDFGGHDFDGGPPIIRGGGGSGNSNN